MENALLEYKIFQLLLIKKCLLKILHCIVQKEFLLIYKTTKIFSASCKAMSIRLPFHYYLQFSSTNNVIISDYIALIYYFLLSTYIRESIVFRDKFLKQFLLKLYTLKCFESENQVFSCCV